MHNILVFLNGKKTYLSAGIGMGIGVAYFFHLITPDQFNALSLMAASFGLVGIRSAMDKFQPTIINKRIDLTQESV